jgi:enamine deaminase RidA (YjgF/YER057c/UK114 family)
MPSGASRYEIAGTRGLWFHPPHMPPMNASSSSCQKGWAYPLACLGTMLFLPLSLQAAELRAIDASEATGSSMAVVVGRTPLAFTGLILPVDDRGKTVGLDHPTIQTERALDNLALALAEAKSGLDRVVRLNLYVKDADVVRDAQRVFSRRFSGPIKPALTIVESALPLPDAYLALDAVAACAAGQGEKKVTRLSSARLAGGRSASHVAVLPDGVKVFVAGQAERGTLREATTATMAGLLRTLEFAGLDRTHIVHLKAFLTPMAAHREVEEEIARVFAGEPIPPLTFVEWTSTLPIEIELVAYGGDQGHTAREPVEYLTPTGLTASPIYSRVARVNFGNLVFLSGLYGSGQSADLQIRDIFSTLEFLAGQGGSDLRHLVKATYYVSESQTSQRLNDLRPNFYDPKRPPAASKVMVRGVGQKERTITVDMIGVSKR